MLNDQKFIYSYENKILLYLFAGYTHSINKPIGYNGFKHNTAGNSYLMKPNLRGIVYSAQIL